MVPLHLRLCRGGRRAVVGGAAAAGALAAGLDRAGVVGAAGARPSSCRRWPSGPPERCRPVLLLIAWAVWFAFCTAAAAVGNEWKYEGFWVAELVIWPAAAGLLAASARRWRGRPYCTLWLVGLVFWLAALALAAAAALGHRASAGWRCRSTSPSTCRLFVGLCARGRPSFAGAGDRGGAGGLDGAGIGPRPPAHRHDHGEPGPYPVPLGPVDSSERSGRGLWRELPGDVRGGVPGADGALRRQRWAFWPMAPAAAVLAAALVYGQFRTAGQYTEPGGRVALIQGSIDTQMKSDPTMDEGELRSLLATVVQGGPRPLWQGRSDRLAGNHVPLAAVHPRRRLTASRQTFAELSPEEFRKRLEKAAQRRPSSAGRHRPQPRHGHDPRHRPAALRARGRRRHSTPPQYVTRDGKTSRLLRQDAPRHVRRICASGPIASPGCNA